MDVDETIHRILNAVDEIEGMECRNQWSKEKWTRRIKTALCKVGKRNGYYICASSVDIEANHGEWLYDVCWLDYDGNDGDWLRWMRMAAESEWGENIGAIEDDFSKLLVARASLRVMVCDGWHLSGGEKGYATVERLQQSVHEFEGSQTGDTYLLIVYEWYKNRWRSHSWRYRLDVTRAGTLPTLKRL